MPATLALIAQVLAMIPSLLSAGIAVEGLIDKIRVALGEAGAPGNPEWDALDAQCAAIEATFQKDAAPPPATSG